MTDDKRDLGAVMADLAATIASRKEGDPAESYTAKLLQGHEDQLLKKIGEEATEVVMAAKDADPAQLRYEAGDLIYHLLVVCERWGVSLDDLASELDSRRK